MSKRAFLTIEEFRAQAQAAKAAGKSGPEIEGLRASFDSEAKAGDGESRTINFTISTDSVDRYGDTIAVDGWQLDAYRKNPVVLWAHDGDSLPVGRANKLWTEPHKLKAETEFTPAGMSKFNDTVYEMYRLGFMSATSVGFMPLKYAFVDDPERRYGIDFQEQELLEFSTVPVPANAEALIEGKKAGIDVAVMLDWATDLLGKAGDSDRIVKLAESVLGKTGCDLLSLAWAERIVKSAGRAVVSQDRLDRIERSAKQARLAKKRQRDLDLIRVRAIQPR